jgi:aspartyl-tRNA(Asn)/glutamyl-tRNA(Gln) amidotransferase subunit A
MIDPAGASIVAFADRIRRRESTSTQLVEQAIDRALSRNTDLIAFISIYVEEALAEAHEADRRISAGEGRGVLDGIPIAVKDNLYLRDRTTTMGSKIDADFVPDITATAVARLTDAGAVVIGKTNLDEYALGGNTENPYYGSCRNPRDTARSPGGSSGGSAAAVSDGIVTGALGSDTSGSIRIPASMCGVVGLKPTYGRVSRHGCYPEAPTLDHVGPLAASVADVAIMLDAISGWDPDDPTTLHRPATSTYPRLRAGLTGIVIGVEEDFFFGGVDDDIGALVTGSVERLRQLGAVIRPITIDGLRDADAALNTIDAAETTSIHQRHLREQPNGYSHHVRLLLERGALVSAVDYLNAQQVRERLRGQFRAVFREVQAIVAPALPLRTPRIGERTTIVNGVEVSVSAHVGRLLGPANLLGLPSLTLPCGYLDHLPVGIQVLGPPLGEQQVLDIGFGLEQASQ